MSEFQPIMAAVEQVTLYFVREGGRRHNVVSVGKYLPDGAQQRLVLVREVETGEPCIRLRDLVP